MPPLKPPPKKMSASEAHALREAQLLAESKPKPLPRRRRMNDEMREQLSDLRFIYHFGDSPFLPDDWLFGGDLIHDAWSISVEIVVDGRDHIGSLEIHTLPLGVDWDLFEMADATTTVPHWAVGDAIAFSWPRDWLVDNWEVENPPEGASVMLVDNIELTSEWEGWGLEPVFTAIAMHRVAQMVAHCTFALATPVYWWQRAEEKKYGKVVYERSFKELGFSRMKKGSDTWILPNFRTFERQCQRIKEQLKLPEHLFAPAWSERYPGV